MARITDIPFTFLCPSEDTVLVGTVEFRIESMVIDISDSRGARPYLILGKAHDNYFEGADNAGIPGEEVRASWARLGNDVFVGTWIEGNEHYLFSFDCSPKAREHAALRDAKYSDAMNHRLPGSYGSSKRR